MSFTPEDQDLSTAELILRSGGRLKKRTLERYRAQKCPACWLRNGEVRWSYPRLLAWVRDERAKGRLLGIRGRQAGAEALNAIVPEAAAAAEPKIPHELVAQMRAVESLDQMTALRREIIARQLSGELTGQASTGIARQLADLEKTLRARAQVGAAPEILVSDQAAEVARLFEGIVDGKKRAELLEAVRDAALEDARAFPPEEPEACRTKLAERGLDAFGEPLPSEGPATVEGGTSA